MQQLVALRGTLWSLTGIIVVHLTIALLFIRGFFLSKNELLLHSECEHYPLSDEFNYEDIFHALNAGTRSINKCWSQQQYDKVIILIVDALKFDFAAPFLESDRDVQVTYYSHHLPSIASLLQTSPSHSKLFRFISDPPTVTAQRIKGFTTGGLPTFFDVRNSFTSQQIVIDNLLYQLKVNGEYRLSFMGDDTWNDLYDAEFYFNENHPFPSFDVYDLDTVDNGCTAHLYPSLYDKDVRQSWDVLIAHFLGVDHVGHRYHMNHPKMAEKLDEMNHVITNVTDWMTSYKQSNPSEDVLLLVFGDHGMTATGDHGGATVDETNAALFVHSTKYLHPHNPFESKSTMENDHHFREVTQINIVPTLCLLMGVPIPFENIGALIPELWIQIRGHQKEQDLVEVDDAVLLESWKDLLRSMALNALQVYRYLVVYDHDANSDTFSNDEMTQIRSALMVGVDRLKALHPNTEDLEEIKEIVGIFQLFLVTSYRLCLEKWTTFNLHVMAFAILIGLVTVIGLGAMCCDPHLKGNGPVIQCDLNLLFGSWSHRQIDLGVVLLSVLYLKYYHFWDRPWTDWWSMSQIVVFSIGCCFAISLCLQYIGELREWMHCGDGSKFEGIAVMVMMVMYFQGLFTDSFIKYEAPFVLFLVQFAWTVLVISNLREHSTLDMAIRSKVRYSMCWVLPIMLCLRWMGLNTLNEMEPDYPWLSPSNGESSTTMMSYISILWRQCLVVIPAILIPILSISMHVQCGMTLNAQNVLHYGLTIGAEVLLMGYWIAIGDGSALRNGAEGENKLWIFPTLIWSIAVIQMVLWRMNVSSWNLNHSGHFMVALIQFMVILNPSLCLVLGANSHMFLVYILGILYFATFIQSVNTLNCHLKVVSDLELWIGWLLHQYLFFVTGHRCIFSQISFKAAYVGLFSYNFGRALVLTLLHQFSGHLFAFLIIPILVTSRLSLRNITDSRRMVDAVRYNLSRFVNISCGLSTLLVVCSMCNCFIHRRHLLVWDVFAPKIIFDIVNVLVMDILHVVSTILVSFILSNVSKRKLL